MKKILQLLMFRERYVHALKREYNHHKHHIIIYLNMRETFQEQIPIQGVRWTKNFFHYHLKHDYHNMKDSNVTLKCSYHIGGFLTRALEEWLSHCGYHDAISLDNLYMIPTLLDITSDVSTSQRSIQHYGIDRTL